MTQGTSPFKIQIGGNHYKSSDDLMDVAEFCERHKLTPCQKDAIKYIYRHGKKGTPEDGKKDLLKAMHYILFMLYLDYNMSVEDVLAEFSERDIPQVLGARYSCGVCGGGPYFKS